MTDLTTFIYHLPIGTVVVMYTGSHDLSINIPLDAPGSDKIVVLLRHKFKEDLDIIIDPTKSGRNVAQFASTASPHGELEGAIYTADYKNANCILRAKEVCIPVAGKPGEFKQVVCLFLVAIKPIKRYEAITWFYGFEYFKIQQMLKINWLTVKELNLELQRTLKEKGEIVCTDYSTESHKTNIEKTEGNVQ